MLYEVSVGSVVDMEPTGSSPSSQKPPLAQGREVFFAAYLNTGTNLPLHGSRAFRNYDVPMSQSAVKMSTVRSPKQETRLPQQMP